MQDAYRICGRGKACRLRAFREEDAETLYRNHCEEELRRWIPNESYADLEEAAGAARFFARCAQENALPYVLAIEDSAAGGLIGDIGLNEVDGEPGEIEIGFSVCERAAGRGTATEAARKMLAIGREAFGAKRIYGRVLKGNAASCRVLEKCGFRLLREEQGAPDDPYGNGMLVYVSE